MLEKKFNVEAATYAEGSDKPEISGYGYLVDICIGEIPGAGSTVKIGDFTFLRQ